MPLDRTGQCRGAQHQRAWSQGCSRSTLDSHTYKAYERKWAPITSLADRAFGSFSDSAKATPRKGCALAPDAIVSSCSLHQAW